jgi:hypothetical protein
VVACTCVYIGAVLLTDELEQAIEFWVLIQFLQVFLREHLHFDIFLEGSETQAFLALVLNDLIFCYQQLDSQVVLVHNVLQKLRHGSLDKRLRVNEHTSILQHLLGLSGLRLKKVEQ